MTQTPETEILDAELIDEHAGTGTAAGGQQAAGAGGGRLAGPVRRRVATARQAVADPAERARARSWVSEQSRLVADGMRGRALARREAETLAEYRERGDPDAPVREDLRSHYEKALDRRAKAQADADDDWAVEDYLRYGGWGALGVGELAFLGELVGTVPGMLGALGWLVGAGNVVAAPLLARRLRRQGQAYRDKLAAREQLDGAVTVDGNLPVRPIAEAAHDQQALELLRRSLLAQSIPVNVVAGRQTAWGWELTMQLVGGSGKRPGDVIKKLEHLEADLDVRQNGVLVQPHVDRRARFTARIIESDPFATMPPLPAYRPGSRTLAEPIELGKRLDGVTMTSAFLATHGIILAASGGGKSGMIRTVVDGLAVTVDAILWDLDPSGVGQAPQAAVMGRRALCPDDCETALRVALRIAESRTRIKDRLGMGDEWQPSAEHPALCCILDEFPRLSTKAKELAVALLRVARKAGVILLFASQSAKKDALGDSVAGEVAWKAGGPGLAAYQARLLFGETCIAEGYNPGAFKPKRGANLNDTGTFFLEGAAEGDEPIPMRGHFITTEAARSRAERAAAAGRPAWDTDTLTATGLTAAELTGVTDEDDIAEAQRAAHDADEARARLGALAGVADYLDADLDDDGREFVSSAELATELGYTSPKALAAALKPFGLTPGQGYWTDDNGDRKETRGFKTADINAAITAAQGGQSPAEPAI